MKYILLILLWLPVMTNAEVYKWTDAYGKTHYGDRPADDNAEQMKLESSPGNGQSVGNNPAADNRKAIDNWLKARDEERELKKQQEAALAKEKAEQRVKCAGLRNELRDRQQGGVVWYTLDEAGKRRYYSDKEIAAQIEDLKKSIHKQCR